MADDNKYEEMSYRDLQAEAKRLGLKASGKKEELVARIVEHLSGSSAGGCDAAPAPAEPVDQEQEAAEQPEQQEAPAQVVVVEESVPAEPEQPQEQETQEAAAATSTTATTATSNSSGSKKRKSEEGEAEAAAAPSLKHLKSPGVMLTRRPVLPTSQIKPPAIFAAKRLPSTAANGPMPSTKAAPATAAAASPSLRAPGAAGGPFSARKSILSSTSSGSASKPVVAKKPIVTGPTPFGPGTYGNANTKAAAVGASSSSSTTAGVGSSSGRQSLAPVAATASARAALVKERPKLTYKPHTGPLRPFFSPKPFLMPAAAAQHRKPLGNKANNGNVGPAAGAAAGKAHAPVVVKPGAAAVAKPGL